MLAQLKPAFLMTVVLTLITGVIYPLVVTGVAQTLFSHTADGSLVSREGKLVGSALIGQNFSRAGYFHPRPSDAGANGYDPTASGGSNLGPTNPDLAKRLQKDSAAYQSDNHVQGVIPSDAVTTSASGLDPDISPANALLQAERVARTRGVDLSQVRTLVENSIAGRQLGVLGEPRVNVLCLNLALDQRFPIRHQLF